MSSPPVPIPEFMKMLSKNIRLVFQELVRAVLRGSVMNGHRMGGRRCDLSLAAGVSGHSRNLIDWYTYKMTTESLGWTGDIYAHLRMTPKTLASSSRADCNGVSVSRERVYPIPPLGGPRTKEEISCRPCGSPKVHPSSVLSRYENFLQLMAGKRSSPGGGINRPTVSYTVGLPYTLVFLKLEKIGEDIINQSETDESDRSVASLMRALEELDLTLDRMSNETPFLHASYMELLLAVNGLPKKALDDFVRLIALLTFRRWTDLTVEKRNYYRSALGEAFVEKILKNELANLLIQSDQAQLIISTAYLYPLLKMLFTVFGYSRLEPFIIDRRETILPLARLRECGRIREYSRRGRDSDREQTPYDPSLIRFINLFRRLYPALLALCGGIASIPPEAIAVECDLIPTNYDGLGTIPEYLWRFNDYSFCQHSRLNDARCASNFDLEGKVDDRVRYLRDL